MTPKPAPHSAGNFADKVKLDVSERMQRWARIEELLGVEMQQPPSRGVAVTQRAAEGAEVGATVPAHLARPISSAALRLLDSDIDMQQPRQAAGRRRSSARPADALPAACGSGLTWPKTSAAALAAAAGSEATADASGSPQLQPSGAASAHSFETGSDLLLRSCGQRPEQLLAVAQFHVPDGYADVDSPRVSPERQQSQPVGPEAVSSRAASLISAAPSSPSDAGDASVGARKSKAAAGSKLAKLRALSIFAGRSARRRSKNK
uniref:Shugoshin_C domain-containing protein n=1 Tax=Macrostomum lignano TaxID=282301 RepID=A0A1I8I9I6_9PLAT